MTEKELFQEALEWREHIAKLAADYSDQELFQRRLRTFNWLVKCAEKVVERVQKLEKELDEAVNIGLKMEGEANEWERKAKRYKQALEFYADKKTYETNVTDQWEPVTPIFKDNGKIAREALEGED